MNGFLWIYPANHWLRPKIRALSTPGSTILRPELGAGVCRVAGAGSCHHWPGPIRRLPADRIDISLLVGSGHHMMESIGRRQRRQQWRSRRHLVAAGGVCRCRPGGGSRRTTRHRCHLPAHWCPPHMVQPRAQPPTSRLSRRTDGRLAVRFDSPLLVVAVSPGGALVRLLGAA